MKHTVCMALMASVLCGFSISSAGDAVAAVSDLRVPGIKNLQVTISTAGLAKSAQARLVPRSPNHPDEPPFMNGEPEHVQVSFENDKLTDFPNYLQRQLIVYPIEAYGALYKGKERVAFAKVVPELKSILKRRSDRNIKELPVLPAAEAYQVFHNQTKYLKFKQGSGIAFLTSYAQDEAPINNGDFFYTFQGLTGDGKYYVSMFYPVTVKQLPANPASKKTAGYLGRLPRNRFIPSLDAIDSAIQSISLSAQAPVGKTANAVQDEHAIIPGSGIGIVKLGLNRRQITETLGKRDGNYALYHGIQVEYSIWKDPVHDSIIRVFFDAGGKTVQIGCEAPIPATAEGISLKSSLSDVNKKYRHLKRTHYTGKGIRIDYYDDVQQGIAFAFIRAANKDESQLHLHSILVHRAGQPVLPDLYQQLIK